MKSLSEFLTGAVYDYPVLKYKLLTRAVAYTPFDEVALPGFQGSRLN